MSMASRHEVLEDSRTRVGTEESEDLIYFAARKELNECGLNLLWLLQNSGGKSICIFHVHQPAKWIPGLVMGAKYPVHALVETEVKKYREAERREMHHILDGYLRICRQWEVNAQKLLHIEMESVEKGIVELIYQRGIRQLVMGAAADGRYKKNMTEVRSKKARYVCEKAPAYSHIQFICGGHYILSRQFAPYHTNESSRANNVIGRSIYRRSVSEQLNRPDSGGTGQQFGLQSRSVTCRHERADSTPTSFFHNIRTLLNGTKKSSSSETGKGAAMDPSSLGKEISRWNHDHDLFSLPPAGDSGRPSTVVFGSPSSHSIASTGSTSSSNAQEGWIQRKEVEEMLAKEREWLRKELGTSKQREESLESHIQKLQMELNNALKEAEVLKGINQQQQDSTTRQMPQFPWFLVSEVEEVTHQKKRGLKKLNMI